MLREHRAALVRARDGGRLAGVGLDVFWDEPWDPNDPLFHRDDVIAADDRLREARDGVRADASARITLRRTPR